MQELDQEEVLVQDELATLKARADLLGISYHPSIGADRLREKVAAKLAEGDAPAADSSSEASAEKETEGQKRVRLKKQASELVRIRVTCMNPAKKEWEGEIFTVGNSTVGTFKKYVPFNADDGWHVPRIIYNQIVQRQCQVFQTITLPGGNKTRKGKLIREFAVEVLPALTKDELKDLAQRQAMAGGL
tara:strand:- start:2045 stop:2608 length:564 start_codon:yes stop_codon:yes gene_type:complete